MRGGRQRVEPAGTCTVSDGRVLKGKVDEIVAVVTGLEVSVF